MHFFIHINILFFILIQMYDYIFTNSLKPCLLVCHKFFIPTDIFIIIYNYVINASAQIIINSWYNHITLHNINLCNLINRLHIYMFRDIDGSVLYYFDLYDPKIGTTFNICHKYINLNISDINWWMTRINYALNGLYFNYYNYNNTFKYNLQAIYKLYNLFKSNSF